MKIYLLLIFFFLKTNARRVQLPIDYEDIEEPPLRQSQRPSNRAQVISSRHEIIPNPPPAVPVPSIIKQINEMNEDGSYTFGYESDDGTYRVETRGQDGVTRGKYGYLDANGVLREVEYKAGQGVGYEPSGDNIKVPPPRPPVKEEEMEETDDLIERSRHEPLQQSHQATPQHLSRQYQQQSRPLRPKVNRQQFFANEEENFEEKRVVNSGFRQRQQQKLQVLQHQQESFRPRSNFANGKGRQRVFLPSDAEETPEGRRPHDLNNQNKQSEIIDNEDDIIELTVEYPNVGVLPHFQRQPHFVDDVATG